MIILVFHHFRCAFVGRASRDREIGVDCFRVRRERVRTLAASRGAEERGPRRAGAGERDDGRGPSEKRLHLLPALPRGRVSEEAARWTPFLLQERPAQNLGGGPGRRYTPDFPETSIEINETSWIFTILQCFLGNLGVNLIHTPKLCAGLCCRMRLRTCPA